MSKEKILIINSADKDWGNNSKFTVQFSDSSTQQVQKVLVKQIYIPNVFYNINEGNNLLTVKQASQASIIVTIPVGQYNINSLITQLTLSIDSILIDNCVIAIAKTLHTDKLIFTFSGSNTPANNLVNFLKIGGITDNIIDDVIGLTLTTNNITGAIEMNEPWNLNPTQYIQVTSPEVGYLHGLDSGKSKGYISLIDCVPLNNAPFGATAVLVSNDDEMSEILYESPRDLSTVSVALRDENGRFLKLPDNHNMSIVLKMTILLDKHNLN